MSLNKERFMANQPTNKHCSPPDQTPALTALIEHNFATGTITGSHWVLSGDMGKNVTAAAGC